MAILAPMGWGQNVGATNSAQVMRLYMGGSAKGSGALTSLLAGRGGIVQRAPGMNLRMLQVGGGNMTVNLEPGVCYVPGTEALSQGGYWAANDATLNIGPFTTAHATLNRIDTVYCMIRDSAYSTAFNDARFLIQNGTAGSGVAGDISAIANAFKIGEVTVRAGAASILTADINNNGAYFCAPGGVTATRSGESSVAGTHGSELRIFSNNLHTWDSSALLWRQQGIAKVGTTGSVPNPQTDDLAYVNGSQMFQRYTGSVWQDWVPTHARTRLRQTSVQVLANTVFNKITFNVEDSDDMNAHSTVSNTSRFTCNRDGSYRFAGAASADPNGTGFRITRWSKNNTPLDGSSIALPAMASIDNVVPARTVTVDLVAGDYMELELYQSAGGTLNTAVVTFSQSSMEVEFLGL